MISRARHRIFYLANEIRLDFDFIEFLAPSVD